MSTVTATKCYYTFTTSGPNVILNVKTRYKKSLLYSVLPTEESVQPLKQINLKMLFLI